MKLATCVAACLIAALPATGSAQVYQWKDSNGRTVISDTPPPSNAKGSRSIGTNPPSSSTAAPAGDGASAAPKSVAEKDMDFKKRQQEAKEKADKDAKEQAAAAENKENCTRARQQLAALESGVRITATDEKGERRFMEDAERQREIERSRKIVAETCK